ncbi:unnamed protein product [Tuber melanosporum]|uniref:(Perigord truffle) hypothetical protein n=1 Tax=Tuber melanosporum (strain Mel28) TaxID=656061 RepID=D5GK66_TUBMM|nr:unnamed protein product [Tuber melanosporum]
MNKHRTRTRVSECAHTQSDPEMLS